ncbi:MAG: DUF1987 domain-containing protein [Bacteroidota bacterium]|nr:DUF1987 domain-containing protein [Bacteroidota bacterium]
MNVIQREGKQDTPSVVLNKEKGIFKLEGKSFPADVGVFYEDIVNWLDEYALAPNKETDFIMKMDYFNTASSKVILDILYKLEDIKLDGHNVCIKWYYPDDDEDMMETGEEYDEIVDVDFELIEYTVEYDD